MSVYLKKGIWRDLDDNKLYSTPVQYVELAHNIPT